MEELKISPKYIVNDAGERVEVVLQVAEFSHMLDLIEELQDVRDFDAAKATATEFVSLGELRKHLFES